MNFPENAKWLKNRFQSMEAAELFSRLADLGRHLIVRTSLKRFQQPGIPRIAANTHISLPKFKRHLNHLGNHKADLVIAAADQWLKRRASFFSLQDIPLGEPINWHRDYSTGVVAPLRYSALINPRDRATVGDVKYVWELNRLQHLVILALAWSWTRNAKYWLEAQKQILSWTKSNPFMMGLNWKSPLEAAIRLISWAHVYFLTAESRQSRELFHNVLRNSIYHHQYFIRNFYSKHSSANNHLVGEMAGLYTASVFWPFHPDSRSWRNFARDKLIEEIDRQVEPDGVSKERALEYQIFVLELFLLAGALGQVSGDPYPEQYWQRINGMLGFLLAISNRAGDLPLFGDGDSAHVISLPQTTPAERTQSLLKIGQSRGDSSHFDLRFLFLLWGQKPEDIPIGAITKARETVQVFPQGGYYVLCSKRGAENECLVVFDAGPLGFPPLNAHGHADALNFCFSYGGTEFLIDPGTYCYQAGSPWRSYFRGTAAHNTVRVDGEDQSVSAGSFLWRGVARAWIDRTRDTDTFVEIVGSHDGYRRLSDPVIHTRSLRLSKTSPVLIITDRLECQGSHNIEVLFHFSEKCHVLQTAPTSFEAVSCDRRLLTHIDPGLTPELYRGSEAPIFGWASRRFGVKTPSFTLVARASIKGSAEFVTTISAVNKAG